MSNVPCLCSVTIGRFYLSVIVTGVFNQILPSSMGLVHYQKTTTSDS